MHTPAEQEPCPEQVIDAHASTEHVGPDQPASHEQVVVAVDAVHVPWPLHEFEVHAASEQRMPPQPALQVQPRFVLESAGVYEQVP